MTFRHSLGVLAQGTRGADPINYPTIRSAEKVGASCEARKLVEGLDLDDAGPMIATDPEYRPLGGAIHEHTPDIGRARQQVVDHLASRGVDPGDLIGQHRAGP